MLIPFSELQKKYDMQINGILHVGAHNCEELMAYIQNGVEKEKTYWVEAMENKVILMKQIYGDDFHIYQAVIDETDDKTVTFNITNNGESSSILEFGSHSTHHPHVKVTSTENLSTTRLDTLIEKQDIPIENINFINLDIQGVELRALKSMEKYLKHIKYIYSEVNTEQVYKDCAIIHDIDGFLFKHGFKRTETRIYQQYGWGDAFYVKDN
jgi:FkbM family methyltransferase